MKILPVTTGLLARGDDLAAVILKNADLKDGDIVVLSSKVIAMTESGPTDLRSLSVSAEAKAYAKQCRQDAQFTEFVLQETKRLGGKISCVSPYAILTSLRPKGMKTGRILCPNAGADRSNTGQGSAIGWPQDAAASAKKLHAALGKQAAVGVIVSDSCCHPGRLGVTAFALTVAGLDPIRSDIGTPDLFGSPLVITHEAVADQLATAANSVMGNAAQATPAAIIRGHGLPFSGFSGWVPGIEPEDDLFCGTLPA